MKLASTVTVFSTKIVLEKSTAENRWWAIMSHTRAT